jgi:hypothetical protein
MVIQINLRKMICNLKKHFEQRFLTPHGVMTNSIENIDRNDSKENSIHFKHDGNLDEEMVFSQKKRSHRVVLS